MTGGTSETHLARSIEEKVEFAKKNSLLTRLEMSTE